MTFWTMSNDKFLFLWNFVCQFLKTSIFFTVPNGMYVLLDVIFTGFVY